MVVGVGCEGVGLGLIKSLIFGKRVPDIDLCKWEGLIFN